MHWRLTLKNHKGKNSLATLIPLKSLFPGNQHCIYHNVPKLDISLSLFPMKFLFWLLSCAQLFCDSINCSLPGSLFMGFPRQEYCNRLPFPSPGDLTDPEIEPGSPVQKGDSLPLCHKGSPSPWILPLWSFYWSLPVWSQPHLLRSFLLTPHLPTLALSCARAGTHSRHHGPPTSSLQHMQKFHFRILCVAKYSKLLGKVMCRFNHI